MSSSQSTRTLKAIAKQPPARPAPTPAPPTGPLDLATASLSDLDDIKVKTRGVGSTKQVIVGSMDEVVFTGTLARELADPSTNLYGKGIDTAKFSIIVEIPLAQTRMIQKMQVQIGSDWKPFAPALGRLNFQSQKLLTQTVGDVNEFDYDHHLQGQADHNRTNEYKVNQPERPVITFMDTDKEFLDYRDIQVDAKLRILAKVDGWQFGNSKWTLRFKAVTVTMLEQGPIVEKDAVVVEVAPNDYEELPSAFELPKKKMKRV